MQFFKVNPRITYLLWQYMLASELNRERWKSCCKRSSRWDTHTSPRGQVFRRNDEKRHHKAGTTAPKPRKGHQGAHHAGPAH